MKDYPGASAAFHTCNGVSGVIHLGNETFVIHPFYGGDLSVGKHFNSVTNVAWFFAAEWWEETFSSICGWLNISFTTYTIFFQQKHPHIIFEARTKGNKGCANSGNLLSAKNRRQKHVLGLTDTISDRYKRDVREASKFIETAIIIDKAMVCSQYSSSCLFVLPFCSAVIQLILIAD